VAAFLYSDDKSVAKEVFDPTQIRNTKQNDGINIVSPSWGFPRLSSLKALPKPTDDRC